MDAKISPLGPVILERLQADNVRCAANDSIADHLTEHDVDRIEQELERHFDEMLDAMVIARDHNTDDTPGRMARMFVREVFKGRYTKRPKLTDFPNVSNLDELYAVGPITVRSTCAHHFCPIIGQAWCGVIPSKRIIGLSKFARLTDWIMSRPQIQEEAVVQLADELEGLLDPRGLAVVIRAQHACMTMRGVREHDTTMTTSVMRGLMKDDPKARGEFMATIAGQGF